TGRGAEALLGCEVLERVPGAVILVELVGHAGSGQRGAVVLHVLRRGVGVLIAEEADHRTVDVPRQLDQRLVAGTEGLLDVAPVKHRGSSQLWQMAGGQPGHAPTPAMAD